MTQLSERMFLSTRNDIFSVQFLQCGYLFVNLATLRKYQNNSGLWGWGGGYRSVSKVPFVTLSARDSVSIA